MNIQIAIQLAVAYKEARMREQSRKTAADMPVRAKSPNYNPHPVDLDNKYKKDWDSTMKVVDQRYDRQTDRLNKIRDDYIWNPNQGFGYNLGGYGQAAGDVVTGAESLAAGLGTGLLAASTGPVAPVVIAGAGSAAAGATGAALGPINRAAGNYYLGGIGKKIDSALGRKTDEEKTNEQLANTISYTPGRMALDAVVNAVPAAAVTGSAARATATQLLPNSLGDTPRSLVNYYVPKRHIVDPSERIPVNSYKYRTGRVIDLDGNTYGTAAVGGKPEKYTPGAYIRDRNAKYQQSNPVYKNFRQEVTENPKASVQEFAAANGFKFPPTEGRATYFGDGFNYTHPSPIESLTGDPPIGFSGIKRFPIDNPLVGEVKVLSPSEAADKALGGEILVNGERHPKLFADGVAPADAGLTREKIVAWLKEQARSSTGKDKITKQDLFAEYTKPENTPVKAILDGYRGKRSPRAMSANKGPGEFTIPVNGEPRQSYLYDGFYDSDSNEHGWLYPYLGAERELKLKRLAGSVGVEAASNLSGKVIKPSDTDKR